MDTKATRSLKIFIAALALQGPLAVADPAAVTPAPEPELLARCARCHAPDGAGATPGTPHLEGQLHRYLVDSIELLIEGKRHSSIADHLPSELSRAQILALASHYSRLPARRGADEVDPDKVQIGEMIYMERCMACHEDSGRSTDNKGLGTPVLAGQRLSYLREQTQAYLAKRRKYLDSMKESAFTGKSLEINGTAVREAIGALGHEDAESLAHFFSSIRPAAATGRRRR